MTAFDNPTELNTSCTHKQVTHRHGTYACYVLDKCRCRPCSAAAVAQRRVQDRNHNYARHGRDEYAPYVSADRAREHVEALRQAGLGSKEIARRSGVAASIVGQLLWDTPSRGRRSCDKRIRRETEQRILGLPIPTVDDLLGGHRVDATPSRNRVRALVHIGYSINTLKDMAGVDRQAIYRLNEDSATFTTARTHRAIAALFARLWNEPNNSTEWRAAIAASRSRRRADHAGWPMPIEVDEAGYLEQDNAGDVGEDIDWIAVRRVLNGEGSATLTSREIDAALALGVEQGLTHRELAARIGITHAAATARIVRSNMAAAS